MSFYIIRDITLNKWGRFHIKQMYTSRRELSSVAKDNA